VKKSDLLGRRPKAFGAKPGPGKLGPGLTTGRENSSEKPNLRNAKKVFHFNKNPMKKKG
jgi:hypothetical protein